MCYRCKFLETPSFQETSPALKNYWLRRWPIDMKLSLYDQIDSFSCSTENVCEILLTISRFPVI